MTTILYISIIAKWMNHRVRPYQGHALKYNKLHTIAALAQSVEYVLGKDGVASSSLVSSSTKKALGTLKFQGLLFTQIPILPDFTGLMVNHNKPILLFCF